jgi:single-strand DNA-binding protein
MKINGMARLGTDMEVKFLPSGDPVGEVSLAFRLSRKDKAGEYQTTWVKAAMFGKRAESMAPYMKKGSMHCFYLKDLHLDEFTGKDGDKRVSLKAIIEDIEFGGGKSEAPARQPAQQSAPASGFDDMDDDIPF